MNIVTSRHRGQAEFSNDSSLIERIENCALILMRGSGKYSERLVDVALELDPLSSQDFTEESVALFEELQAIIETHRLDISTGWGHFKTPSPKKRDRIAEVFLELLRLIAVSEVRYQDQ